jgi:hypothetical protein
MLIQTKHPLENQRVSTSYAKRKWPLLCAPWMRWVRRLLQKVYRVQVRELPPWRLQNDLSRVSS